MPNLMYEKKSKYVSHVILLINVGIRETRANNQASATNTLHNLETVWSPL